MNRKSAYRNGSFDMLSNLQLVYSDHSWPLFIAVCDDRSQNIPCFDPSYRSPWFIRCPRNTVRYHLHTIILNLPLNLQGMKTFIINKNTFFFSMIGDLSGEVNIVVPLMLEGQVEVLAEGVDFRLESALERSPSGSARVVTISCQLQ